MPQDTVSSIIAVFDVLPTDKCNISSLLKERFVVVVLNLHYEGEGRAKGRVRLLRVRGSPKLEKVDSGSATQGLWLGDRKVGSQISGVV